MEEEKRGITSKVVFNHRKCNKKITLFRHDMNLISV